MRKGFVSLALLLTGLLIACGGGSTAPDGIDTAGPNASNLVGVNLRLRHAPAGVRAQLAQVLVSRIVVEVFDPESESLLASETVFPDPGASETTVNLQVPPGPRRIVAVFFNDLDVEVGRDAVEVVVQRGVVVTVALDVAGSPTPSPSPTATETPEPEPTPTPTPTPEPPTFLTPTRISVGLGGAESDGISFTANSGGSISSDGQFLAMASDSTNLVAGDGNGVRDTFVVDTTTAVSQRVSLSTMGGDPDNQSATDPRMTPDGRFVVFSSSAGNLVPGDMNATEDVFLFDRQTLQTERISRGLLGAEPDSTCRTPTISDDGRFVAFFSTAQNLVAGDTMNSDVFVYDRQTMTTEQISSQAADGNSAINKISPSGRYVAFVSSATNLVPGDNNGLQDIFLHDRQLMQTIRLMGASEPDGTSQFPSFSADENLIVFQSSATNLVADDTNDTIDIFVFNRTTGTFERVDLDVNGNQSDGVSLVASISADGRFVVFVSNATNLVPDDTNGTSDVFIKDRQTGEIARVVGPGGIESNATNNNQTQISADGRVIVFLSNATNLVPDDTNGNFDLFRVDNPFLP